MTSPQCRDPQKGLFINQADYISHQHAFTQYLSLDTKCHFHVEWYILIMHVRTLHPNCTNVSDLHAVYVRTCIMNCMCAPYLRIITSSMAINYLHAIGLRQTRRVLYTVVTTSAFSVALCKSTLYSHCCYDGSTIIPSTCDLLLLISDRAS